MPWQAIAALGGKAVDTVIGMRQAAKERKRQDAYAKQGIRWRVEDAKAAGIHPLAALGAPLHQPSPITVGTDFAGVGQDIGRAMDAKRTASERVGAYEKTVQDLTIRRMGLENDLLASQIAKTNQAGHPPPMPVDDAGNPMTGRVALGFPFNTSKKISDAQVFEDRYGEVVGAGAGVGIAAADLMGLGIRYLERLEKGSKRFNAEMSRRPRGSSSGW